MNEEDHSLAELLEAYFERRLTPDQKALLEAKLRDDPGARRAYWRTAGWHTTLCAWAGQSAGRTVAVAEIDSARRPRRSVVSFVALAAAACLVWFVVQGARTWRQRSEVVANVTFAAGADWAGGAQPAARALRRGEYQLQRGVVRFETTAGALVTIAAPAQFELHGAERIALRRGRLTASMLRHGAQLTVGVRDMQVRDLGTAFGVDAENPAHTLVSVFDGLVSVTSEAQPRTEVRVTEGESLVGRHGTVTALVKERYSTDTFKDLWPLTVGVDEASKVVEFLPPGPLLRPLREYHANDHLYLFPEQQKVRTERALPLDLAPQVRTWPESETSPYPLPAGSRVNSYLVFFQPNAASDVPRQFSGRITFNQPILGVVCSEDGLKLSDRVLGDPAADYSVPGQRRGLEDMDKQLRRGATLPHDRIVLSPDGRSVSFELYVENEREQMRIIVAAPAAEEKSR